MYDMQWPTDNNLAVFVLLVIRTGSCTHPAIVYIEVYDRFFHWLLWSTFLVVCLTNGFQIIQDLWWLIHTFSLQDDLINKLIPHKIVWSIRLWYALSLKWNYIYSIWMFSNPRCRNSSNYVFSWVISEEERKLDPITLAWNKP